MIGPARPDRHGLGRLNVAESVTPPDLADCRICEADLLKRRGAKVCVRCDSVDLMPALPA